MSGLPPVVIRLGALGDMVLTTPLLRALAARHGLPCVLAGQGAWTAAVVAQLPYVGAIKTIPSRGMPYALAPPQWALVRFLRRYQGAPAYLLEGDATSAGFAARAGLALTARLRDLAVHDNLHQVEVHARIAGFWSDGGFAPGFSPQPELRLSDGERQECGRWLGERLRGASAAPLVLVHPGNKKTMTWRTRSGNRKSWPQERWVAVVRGVLERLPGAQVLITGTAHEAVLGEGIRAGVADRQQRVQVVAGQTPLRRLFALLERAHSLISVDTGPAHAAGAIGCPVAVLFGATDPRANRPWGPPGLVMVVSGPPGAPEPPGEAAWAAHHAMEGIQVDQVLAAWSGLQGRGR